MHEIQLQLMADGFLLQREPYSTEWCSRKMPPPHTHTLQDIISKCGSTSLCLTVTHLGLSLFVLYQPTDEILWPDDQTRKRFIYFTLDTVIHPGTKEVSTQSVSDVLIDFTDSLGLAQLMKSIKLTVPSAGGEPRARSVYLGGVARCGGKHAGQHVALSSFAFKRCFSPCSSCLNYGFEMLLKVCGHFSNK